MNSPLNSIDKRLERLRAKVTKYEPKYKKIDIEQYHARLVAQAGCCAICSDPFDHTFKGTAREDHDHKTNKFRGLLCNKCNGGLGFFRDSIQYLESAIEYLTKHLPIPTDEEWEEILKASENI